MQRDVILGTITGKTRDMTLSPPLCLRSVSHQHVNINSTSDRI